MHLGDSSVEYMRVPGYGLLDWTAYWQVAKHVKVNGGVYNITDRKYWDYLNSRTQEESTNQNAYDKALAVMPGRTGNWASMSTSKAMLSLGLPGRIGLHR